MLFHSIQPGKHVLKNDIGRTGFRQCIQYAETYVVAGSFVLDSDVAKPNDEVLHVVLCFLFAEDAAKEVEHVTQQQP